MKTTEVIHGRSKESTDSTKPETPNPIPLKLNEAQDVFTNSSLDAGKIAKITDWLRAVGEKKPDSFKKPAEVRDTPHNIGSIIKIITFPSTNQLEELSAVLLPATMVGGVATVFAPTEIAPFVYAAGVLAPMMPLVTEAVLQHLNRIQINDLMIVIKAVSERSKQLATGEEVKRGDLVGELHIEGANVRKTWRKLPPEVRGRALIEGALDGFIKLGNLCQTNDPSLTGIEIFKGISDFVKPGLFKRFGLGEVEEPNEQSSLSKLFIRTKRISALGIIEGFKAPIGDIRTVWITRNNLIKALPKLRQQSQLIDSAR